MREFESSEKNEQVIFKGTVCMPSAEGMFPTVLMSHV